MESEVTVRDKQTSIMERGSLNPAAVLAHVAQLRQMMKDLLVPEVDYGIIPGTDKPTLLKPGAEKLNFTFRLLPKLEVFDRDLPHGHREYKTITSLYHESGVFAGQGVGICSTMESKYRYRWSPIKCPSCGAEAVIKGKEEYGGGWLCFKKKGGCGQTWPDGTKEIESQPRGKVENPDIADVYNTVAKMSKKRSLIDATITACAASDLLTQDLDEDEEAEAARRAAAHGNGNGNQKKAATGARSPAAAQSAPPPNFGARIQAVHKALTPGSKLDKEFSEDLGKCKGVAEQEPLVRKWESDLQATM